MPSNESRSRTASTANALWFFIGPPVLSILAIMVIETHGGWLSPPSITFLVILTGVAVARWLDPWNSDGTPATPRQQFLYLSLTVVFGLLGWIVTHAIVTYWPSP